MWLTTICEQDNNGSNSGKRKNELRPSLLDFDDAEEEARDAAEEGAPQTR
jgi:hypothetical protein